MKTNQITSKRKSSSQLYIDALQENYAKVNVIRVDFGYKKPFSDDITLEDANKDLKQMLTNRRSKPSIFKHNIGYEFKRELTEAKGAHIHGFIYFNGHEVKNDIAKAKQICNYWNKEITKGKGSAYNCNLNADKYQYNGIGMIDHTDKEKRVNLDKAVEYICKDEQVVKSSDNSKTVAYTRGNMPKKKSNAGRPRNEK